ncbi:hypothetical protein M378DRAFT_931219 [Amanita muscaria Koide BX008]|uniref:Uncharacterized protein n=1 Tax=Amanita muscaria (strain Koide BX008) TaxID=946122 RepID=A0A0C2XGP0_AMAMK|nr:hypothetical protein M378DRAFT_931219 [Amanita muscaria Koide BX008]
MAERDNTVRLRNAVKENNLFIVKRLIKKTDMRNPDAAPKRYTSLAWAAVLGHEETFEFLLGVGHDDDESSKDSENNTILVLLADTKPPPPDPYIAPCMQQHDMAGAILRMARLYIDRYPRILDWSNTQGRTALHLASLKGNEELARMFCDFGADVNLADNSGNTPLHYASSWGHVAIVQLLIERGCQYSVKNNSGFTASDYAYSTQDALQNTARLQYELQKKQRRNQVTRGLEANGISAGFGPPSLLPRNFSDYPRTRSGSGTSRTTSDGGDLDNVTFANNQFSSPSQSTSSNSTHPAAPPMASGTQSNSTTKPLTRSPPSSHVSALSPIANRVREMDADAIEKYLLRTRSGSQGTPSHNGTQQMTGATIQDDSTTATLARRARDLVGMPRRLRPSASAAQLRSTPDSAQSKQNTNSHVESRHRAGTNPTAARPTLSPIPMLTRSTTSDSLRSLFIEEQKSEDESYVGPPVQYAQFPSPPEPEEVTTTVNRRKGLHMLLKSSTSDGVNHRRGLSATSIRGG